MTVMTMAAPVGPVLGGSFGSPSDANNSDNNSDNNAKRTSNTEEDAVHQRAMLVLQMATSVETSNNRRRRRLQQIESGTTDHVQQEIDDIMHEKPIDMMTLLKETEPEALPSAKELKERYEKEEESDEEEDSDDDSGADSDGEKEEEEMENEDNEKGNKSVPGKEDDRVETNNKGNESFDKTQDLIVAQSKQVPTTALSNIPTETLQAHTEPLQEQLKRSYAAIVKLRENSDLRYQALEKKYVELKRNQQAQGMLMDDSNATPLGAPAAQDGPAANKEQLTQAFQAIVRLRENSDLRYGVLESKYLDLKRSHAEADSRNERLEADLEIARDNNNSNSSSQMILNSSSASFRNGSLFSKRGNSHGMNGSFSSLLEQLPQSSSHGRKKYKRDKHCAAVKLRKLMEEFQELCEKVTPCNTCVAHVPAVALLKVRQQLAKLERASNMDSSSHYDSSFREEDDDADIEPESDDDKEDEDSDEDTFAGSLASARRHEGAMTLLGANWDMLEQIDERKKTSPGGRFANLRESKSEQKLKGRQSQFVAAQSGVYCRIDHNMKDHYGDLDKFQTPQRPPPSPPSTAAARVRKQPSKPTPEPPALQAPPAIKRPSPQSPQTATNDSSQARAANLPHMPHKSPARDLHSVQILEPALETTPTHDGKRRSVDSPTSVLDSSRQAFPVEQAQPRSISPKPTLVGNRTPPREGLSKAVSFSSQNNSTAPIAKDEEKESKSTTARHMYAPEAPGGSDAWHGFVDMDNSRSSMTNVGSGSNRPRRIPPAKLDAKEREAKRNAALKDAKAAAKNTRKDGKSRKKSTSNVDDNSVLSNASSLTDPAPKQKKASFLKNPFKKKGKSLETAAARTAGSPKVISEVAPAPAKSKKAVKQAPHAQVTKPTPGHSARTKPRSSTKRASTTHPSEC